MSEAKDLSIVIPAYLEEENLRLILPRLQDVITKLGLNGEVLVIDTAEPMDRTSEVCAQHGAKYINRSGGNMYGAAIRTGLAAAVGRNLIMMDADGSHPPEFIIDLYKHVNEADIVVASRYIKGGATENPATLILLSHILNIIYSVCLGIKCKDVSNSFRLYNADKVRSLKLSCNNFDIVEEILVCASVADRNLKILEIPFIFKKRIFGRTKRNLVLFIFTFCTTLVRLMIIRFSNKK